MRVDVYSSKGNLVGTVEVGEKRHDSGYTYKVYQNFEPIKHQQVKNKATHRSQSERV